MRAAFQDAAAMPNNTSLPWPEYLQAWLSALRYHPEQHYFRGSHQDEAVARQPAGAAPQQPPAA